MTQRDLRNSKLWPLQDKESQKISFPQSLEKTTSIEDNKQKVYLFKMSYLNKIFS